MGKDGDQDDIKLYILYTLVFITFYIVLSALLEHKKYPVHRSTVAILVGIGAGLILHLTSPATYTIIAQLDQVLIFEVLLPPMLFAQGYTIHKSAFFKNIKYILVFGVLGTFLSFFVSWGLLYEANALELVRDATDFNNVRTLSDWQILLLAACLCSIDPGVAQESVSSVKFPRLYSVIFGQDILKDTITIVLFQSILKLQTRQNYDKLVLYWYTFFEMLLNFIILILGSIAAALISAFIAIFLFRKMRFLANDRGVSETGFLFLIGFLTYIYTELLGFSGPISVLLYGVLLNHYNIYNMSDQSQHVSVTTFTLISNMCEGVLFLIMGIMVWQGEWESAHSQSSKMTHSYIFFLVVLLILVIARVVNVYILGGLCRLAAGRKFSFSWEEMNMLFIGGMVRGAIPYVLFSSVSFTNNSRYMKNQGIVLKSTVIIVIIALSVVLNSLIPIFYKKRAIKLKAVYRSIFGDSDHSVKKDQKKGKIKEFEEKYLKRWLIVNYEQRKEAIKDMKKRRKEQLNAEEEEENEAALLQRQEEEEQKKEGSLN